MIAPHRKLVLVALTVTLMVALAACGGEPSPAGPDDPDVAQGPTEEVEDDEVYTIRFTTIFGPGSALQDSIDWYLEEVERRTDGRVQAELFYGASLIGGVDTLAALGEGRAEGGYLVPAYTPGDLPLWNIAMMPGGPGGAWQNPEARSRALQWLNENNEAFQEEIARHDVKVVGFVVVSPLGLGTRERVTRLADLEGLQIRAVGTIAEAWRLAGATPVAIEAQETYEALQRGVLDGWSVLPIDTAAQQGLQEVAPHILYTPFGVFGSAGIALSLDLWERMPADIQQIMTETLEDFYPQASQDLIAAEDQACQEFIDAGGGVTLLPDDEFDQWRDTVGDLFVETWQEDAESAGAQPEEIESVLTDFGMAYSHAEDSVTYNEDGLLRCGEKTPQP